MSYKFVALRDVCDITMGQAPSGDTYNTDGKGLPLIAGAGDFGALSPKPSKFTAAPTKTSKPGDIILCIRATIGDLNWSDTEYCLGRGVAGLSCDPETLNQSYLWHWLGYAAPELKAKGRGAIFLQVSKADIEELRIPLPPLPEQRRIAAILDKADALRTKRCEAITKLDQLLQSVFLDMFGDPVTNPKGWPLHALPDCTFFQEGPGILAKDFRNEGVPLVRLAGLNDGRVTLKGCNFVDPKMHQKKWSQFSLKVGDILVLTSATFGNPAIVDRVTAGAIFYTGIIRFRPSVDSLTDDFLRRFLASPWFLRQAQALAAGAVIKHFGPTHLRQMSIPLPLLAEQKKFAAIAERIEDRKRQMMDSAAKLDTLFASLQQRAFAGTL